MSSACFWFRRGRPRESGAKFARSSHARSPGLSKGNQRTSSTLARITDSPQMSATTFWLGCNFSHKP